MDYVNFRFETDADGIALVTWDMPGRSMNLIDLKTIEELAALVERVAADGAIKGAVVTSGKDTFCAGADLTMLEIFNREFLDVAKAQGEERAIARLYEESRRLSLLYRRLETCGKPWAAAINGTVLGGGFELGLACHRRIAADNPKTRIGLPEIKIGLFPGAGAERVFAGDDRCALYGRIARDSLNDCRKLFDGLKIDEIHRTPGHVPGDKRNAVGIDLKLEVDVIHHSGPR